MVTEVRQSYFITSYFQKVFLTSQYQPYHEVKYIQSQQQGLSKQLPIPAGDKGQVGAGGDLGEKGQPGDDGEKGLESPEVSCFY